MKYWAINKTTGKKYGPISKEEMEAYKSNPATDRYDYEEIPTPRKASKPKAVKAAKTKKANESK